MGAPTDHGDVEKGASGHHRAGADGKPADGKHRRIVHAEYGVAWEAVEHPLLDHSLGAAEPLFRRLENEIYRSVEIARIGEIAGGAEQHRGVAVVAAGVHPPVMTRTIVEAVGLMDRQGVHIGPQADRARRIAGSQPADDPRLADTTIDLAAKLGELRRHHIGSALLLEAEFRMSVNVAPPARQVVVNLRNAVNDLHIRSSDGHNLSELLPPTVSVANC